MNLIKYILIIFAGTFSIVVSAENYLIETGQFDKLKINGNVRLVYKNLPDSTGFAFYEAPGGNKDFYKLSVKNDGTLKVEPGDEKWGQTDLPVINVYSDFLNSVESYSELDVKVESVAPNATLSISLVGNGSIIVDNIKSNTVKANINTGNGSIILSGDCVNADFRMVGAGMISADRLSADNVKCKILGTGSIGCWPIDNLTVSGLGSTKIYYKGKPNIKKTGGGKLFELPEEENVSRNKGVEIKSLNPPVTEKEISNPVKSRNDGLIEVEEDGENEDTFKTIVTNDD